MQSGRLKEFGPYVKSRELFDHVVEDARSFLRDRRLVRLVSQQLASADSVCSNIEEGYGRESTKEYIRFLVIARGSLRETQGRYDRFKHWIPADTVKQRVALADEISRLLSATITKLRSKA